MITLPLATLLVCFVVLWGVPSALQLHGDAGETLGEGSQQHSERILHACHALSLRVALLPMRVFVSVGSQVRAAEDEIAVRHIQMGVQIADR
jgi:hypothetical protein